MPEGKPAYWYEAVREERYRLGGQAMRHGRSFEDWRIESAERANAENTPVEVTQQFPDIPVQFQPLR